VSHGRLAQELVDAARTILGPLPALEALPIEWNDDPSRTLARIRQARERIDSGAGVLLVTDMFGGTPTNLALSLLEPGRLEIVTGVNLPMLIRFASLRDKGSLHDVALAVARQGRESIQMASEILSRRPTPGGTQER
jgi:PTS system mannose-specific IIA component